MKIVTYNVNGLRQRVSQFGSLLKLLDSFDADIICFQETKLRRQELTADLAMADGYESFFSCTRTCKKGRVGYSGVATFCRVKSAFSSNEVALPAKAEEGFTGLLENSRDGKDEVSAMAEGLQEFPKDELLNVDTEGRCVITDHGHFVIFNVYGPRAEADDTDRIQFKRNFFEILQKRWESLMGQRRRIFVVGDLNIAPAAIDRCEAGPDFENNEFRKWLRSILVEQGGPFFDVFRAKHPERREAYTCWPSSTGAEQFNYGSRIDHILFAGSCLHQEDDQQCHNFVNCHVKECDILTQYKRLKPENATRWKGGWSFKLEGSDHVPVYTSLVEIPDVLQHNTPSLSSRYLPMIYGLQQTLVSVLMKRQVAKQVTSPEVSSLPLEGITVGSCSGGVKRSSNRCSLPCIAHDESCSSLGQDSEAVFSEVNEESRGSTHEANCKASRSIESEHTSFMSRNETKKKARKGQWSQLSLRSFFQKSPDVSNGVDNYSTDVSTSLADVSTPEHQSTETPVADDHNSNLKQSEMSSNLSSQNQDEPDGSYLEKEKNNVAVQEWQRIQQLMQNSIPLCRGHKEPCVARVVKKPGPTFGRRFYVCARAEGPSSNPEANCGYFRWASSKFREK